MVKNNKGHRVFLRLDDRQKILIDNLGSLKEKLPTDEIKKFFNAKVKDSENVLIEICAGVVSIKTDNEDSTCMEEGEFELFSNEGKMSQYKDLVNYVSSVYDSKFRIPPPPLTPECSSYPLCVQMSPSQNTSVRILNNFNTVSTHAPYSCVSSQQMYLQTRQTLCPQIQRQMHPQQQINLQTQQLMYPQTQQALHPQKQQTEVLWQTYPTHYLINVDGLKLDTFNFNDITRIFPCGFYDNDNDSKGFVFDGVLGYIENRHGKTGRVRISKLMNEKKCPMLVVETDGVGSGYFEMEPRTIERIKSNIERLQPKKDWINKVIERDIEEGLYPPIY